MEKYYEKEHKDLVEGFSFKFKKLNPIDHLSLVTQNIDIEKLEGENAKGFILNCMRNVIWRKGESDWGTLTDSEGNCKTVELEDNPSLFLDLYYRYKQEVLLPVFIESKTFQNLISTKKQ